MAWAWTTDRVTNDKQRLILGCLANCQNHQTGVCNPSIRHIADKTRTHRRTVERTLEALEELGLIERERRYIAGMKTSHQYRLLPLEHELPADPERADGCGTVSHRCGTTPQRMRHPAAIDAAPRRINQEYNQEENREDAARIFDQWDLVRAELANWRRARFADPYTKAAVDAMGGARRLAELPAFDLKQLKFTFATQYRAALTRAADRHDQELGQSQGGQS